MTDEYRVSKKVLEDNNLEIKMGNSVKFSLTDGVVVEGIIVEINDADVKISAD